MKPHPTQPAAFIIDLGELPRELFVRTHRSAGCAEAFYEGGCKTVRQCIRCQRWQCVKLVVLLCTSCRGL